MSIYSWTMEFFNKCREEGDRDSRHLGRYLTFQYDCSNCGPKEVTLPPDYPYAGPSSAWTCKHCAAIMILRSPIPIRGNPKSITLETVIRKGV